MELHILSDLHTEFSDFGPPRTDADIVVLVGDIGVGTSGIEWAAARFSDVPVVHVPGNHEFYGQDIRNTDRLQAIAPGNVHVLDNEVLDIERYRSDLWIHGHTHVACDYEIFGTRVVCNSRGYPGEE